MKTLPNLHKHIALYLSVLLASAAFGQNDSRNKPKVTIVDTEKVVLQEVSRLPQILKEASGLAITKGGYLWSHNDGGIPALYCLDTLGNLIRAVHINASNRGWEDLAVNESDDMFIGSFGNNGNDRKNLRIFKFKNPERTENSVIIPEIIDYSYADQKQFPPPIEKRNFDVDAFFAWRGSLFLFTKNRSKPSEGVSKIYRLSQQPGHQTAQLMDSLWVGDGAMINNWITSADVSPDKKTIALLFHNRVWFIRNFTENKFSNGNIYEVSLKHYSHKAGIAFMTNSVVYIVDELELGMIGGRLYTMNLTSLWREVGE